MDRMVVGAVFFGVVAAVTSAAQLLDVVWCSALVVVAVMEAVVVVSCSWCSAGAVAIVVVLVVWCK